MKNNVKCYRCGKEYEFTYKNVSEIISCSHCHQQMCFTKETKKHLKLIRYIFVFLICLAIAFGMSRVSKNDYVVMLGTMMVAMLIALYSDRICMYLTMKIFGLEYEEYHPEKKTKKEIRKERNQPKKGCLGNRNGFYRKIRII